MSRELHRREKMRDTSRLGGEEEEHIQEEDGGEEDGRAWRNEVSVSNVLAPHVLTNSLVD